MGALEPAPVALLPDTGRVGAHAAGDRAVLFRCGGRCLAVARDERFDRDALGLFAVWFAVPLFALIVLGMGAYNNLRQLHFVLAPAFLVAGIGLSALLRKVRWAWAEVLLFIALILPGVIGILRLHPYEYTYFNALAGGTAGAQGEYALDYWCTSYREAMDYINQVAEPGDQVMAMGPLRPAMAFARSDIEVLRNEGNRSVAGVDYLLTCYRWLGQDWADPELRLVHRVGIGGATFAEVFERTPPEPPAP